MLTARQVSEQTFGTGLRGYETGEVDEFLARVVKSLTSWELGKAGSVTSLDVQQVTFGTAHHGYELSEVDAFLDQVVAALRTHERNAGRQVQPLTPSPLTDAPIGVRLGEGREDAEPDDPSGEKEVVSVGREYAAGRVETAGSKFAGLGTRVLRTPPSSPRRRSPPRRRRFLRLWAVGLVGSFMGGVAVLLAGDPGLWIGEDWVSTRGVVEDVHREVHSDGESRRYVYRAWVRFQDDDRRTHYVWVRVDEPNVEMVSLRYDPSDPTRTDGGCRQEGRLVDPFGRIPSASFDDRYLCQSKYQEWAFAVPAAVFWLGVLYLTAGSRRPGGWWTKGEIRNEIRESYRRGRDEVRTDSMARRRR